MKTAVAEIQWRWVFGIVLAIMGVTSVILFIVIAIYAASRASFGEVPGREDINQFSELLGTYAGPFLFLGLVFAASVWLALRVHVAPRLHGLLIGVIVAVVSTLADLLFSPSLTWFEVSTGFLAVACGWLGGYRGETILKNREAVYRTSQAIKGANRGGMVTAIGEQLANPSVTLIAVADEDGKIDPTMTWVASSDVEIPSALPAFQAANAPATLLTGEQLPWRISGIQSLLLLPLSRVGETLLMASRNRHDFARAEIQKYLTIAEQVALSLENLQLVEEARERGVMDERQRLAAEIHDGLTQGFISIVTHLEVAEARLEQVPPESRTGLQEPLDQARQTARDSLTASRQMIWALRPDLQEGAPLAEALAELTKRWSATNGIPVLFSSSGEERQLHPDIETVLLRTTREALTNVRKHAQADQVAVTLTYLDMLVALDVQDNGQGFDPGALSPAESGSGFGLKSAQVQAERLGGELSIESVPGKGTTIAMALPAT